MDIEYGLKWYKCDFHLHTVGSECFEDKTITAKQWVEEAIKKNLDCIAITDHNTGVSIDEIKKEAENKSLIIFPAVEITCDTSKIHLLILFDVDKSSEDVNDFLIKCDIDRSKFGKQDAYTSKSVLEVAKIADANGCVIIPAHIDEYNGLSSLSNDILNEFLNLPYINAVQFVHEKFLESNLIITENAELKKSNKNLSVKAYHDNLTKILNRNGFLKRLSEINNKYTLAIIDIDKFKSINDTYGHDVGDYVLKDLATLISNKIRTTDIFARWGGEEFVLVLDTPDLLQAQNISDNLRKEIENSKFKTVGKITISIGISEFKTKNDTFEDVFKKADQALYQAKMSGRNRVFVY